MSDETITRMSFSAGLAATDFPGRLPPISGRRVRPDRDCCWAVVNGADTLALQNAKHAIVIPAQTTGMIAACCDGPLYQDSTNIPISRFTFPWSLFCPFFFSVSAPRHQDHPFGHPHRFERIGEWLC